MTIKFDQVIRGDVKIRKIREQTYKIKFIKASEFTLYQVWNDNGNNGNRLVITDSDKKWQERFINENKSSGFEPTTLMAIDNKRWVFVITDAYFEKNKLVLEVSTKPIINLSTTVNKGLITGCFKNVRFDIDSISSTGHINNNNDIIGGAIGGLLGF